MRGNIIFIVLLAVMLFAALAFVISKDWGQSSNIPSQEQARLDASEMISYGTAIRPVIDRMILLSGASDINTSGTGILFAAPNAHADYGTAGTQPTTEVFHASGGKLTYQAPPQSACVSACAYEFTGQYTVTGVGDNGKSELAMVVPNLTQTTCEKVNSLQNLGWASVPTGGVLALARFDGTNYGDNGGPDPVTLTGAGNAFVGKRTFCYRESGGGQRYILLMVVRGR